MTSRPQAAAAPQHHLRDAVLWVRPRTPTFAGAGIAAAALAGFAGLVDGVTENADLATYDPGITSSVADLRAPALTFAAEVVSTVGSEVAIGLFTVLALAWLWFVRDRAGVLLFGATGRPDLLGEEHADALARQQHASAHKLADLLRVLEPFGIRELVQSGMVAIGRGSRSISERPQRPVAVPAPPMAI